MTAPRWMSEATEPTAAERAAMTAELPESLRAGLAAATAPSAAERQALLARRPLRAPSPWGRRVALAGLAAVALLVIGLALQPTEQRLGPSIVLSGERIATATETADGFDVALQFGEVRAEVDPGGERRNLRVIAGDVVVSVKGTVFTVRRDGQAVAVSVERGRVAVEQDNATLLLGAGESWTSKDGIPIAARAPTPSSEPSAPVAEPEADGAVPPGPTAEPEPRISLAAAPAASAPTASAPTASAPVAPAAAAVPSPRRLATAPPPAAPSPSADEAAPSPPAAPTPEPVAALAPEPAPAPPSGAEAWLGLLARLESEPPSDRLLADLEAWRTAHPGSPLADEAALARLELVAAVRPDLAAAELGAWLAAHPRHAAAPRVQTLRLRRLEANAGCGAALPGWMELAESATGPRRAEARARAGLCVVDEQPARGRRLLRAALPELEPGLADAVRARLEVRP